MVYSFVIPNFRPSKGDLVMRNARFLLFVLLVSGLPALSFAQGGKAADVKASVIKRVVPPEALVMENMPSIPIEIEKCGNACA